MNILLTGATGFIGSHLLEELLKENHTVIASIRSQSDLWRIEHLKENEKLIFQPVQHSLSSVFNYPIDTVIHLATHYVKEDTYENIEPMVNSNILFSTQLLELASEHRVKCFINTGTFFEYGFPREIIREDSPKNPVNFYANTKIAFESILKDYVRRGKIEKAYTLRLFSPYGPKDNDKVIPNLIRNALMKGSMQVYSKEMRMNWVYVSDIVKAYMLLITNYEKFDYGYNDFNVCYPRQLNDSIQNIVWYLEEILKIKFPVYETKSAYDTSSLTITVDNSKIVNALKWYPSVQLKEGLAKTIEYYRSLA